MYALYYTIAHHYLQGGRHEYVDNGSRVIGHKTDVEQFLLGLGWRRAYCRLDLTFTRPVRLTLFAVRYFWPLVSRWVRPRLRQQVNGIFAMQKLAWATRPR